MLGLGLINTQNKNPDEHIPLLECNLIIFVRSLDNQQRPLLETIERWLDESLVVRGQRKQQKRNIKLTKWEKILSPQLRSSSLSD